MSTTAVPPGAPIWIDLTTSDADGARAFYEEVFEWKGTEADEAFGGYFNFLADGAAVAGCISVDAANPRVNSWTTYLASSDARSTAAAAAAGGGSIVMPAGDVGDLGTTGLVSDPGGTVVGVWQPKLHTGFARNGRHGTPGWFDLETRSYAEVIAFYRDVFGWTTNVLSDTDEFRYTMLEAGEEQLAGVMDASGFLPEGQATSWTVVFTVDDTDASVAVIEKLGGDVVRPAHDSPYGRLATTTDPTGAKFALISGR